MVFKKVIGYDDEIRFDSVSQTKPNQTPAFTVMMSFIFLVYSDRRLYISDDDWLKALGICFLFDALFLMSL